MNSENPVRRSSRRLWLWILACWLGFGALAQNVSAGWPWRKQCRQPVGVAPVEVEGTTGSWHWLPSPEQEKRVVISLYNRYCVRCHGVDGQGVWDIPDVPNFTNARWQASRSDAQLTRLIIEGRGAVMPAFRGTLNLEEAWAMSRYLRTFVPVKESSDLPHSK